MIDEAIRTQLADVIPAFLIDNAEEDVFPFAVYNLSTEPFRCKGYTSHYTTALRFVVVGQSIAEVRDKGLECIASLEAMPGNTINNTIIQSVLSQGQEPSKLVGESDSQQAVFTEEISFTITHKNP